MQIYRRIAKWLVIFVVIFYLAPVVTAWVVVQYASNGRLYENTQAIPHRSVGLLLGCPRLHTNGTLNWNFVSRVQAASELYHAGKIDSLLVSGNDSDADNHESEDMKKALMQDGVPESKITCDHGGVNTHASMLYAERHLSHASITIISQDWHTRRAIFLAAHCGLDTIAFVAPTMNARDRYLSLVHEHLSRVKAALDVMFVKCASPSLADHA